MRGMSLLVLAAALGACSTGPQPGRSPSADRELQRLLAGKVAGKPVACLSDLQTKSPTVIDDHTILYRDGPTYYRNDFRGGRCPGLSSGFNALLTKRFGGDLCSGDPAEVIETTNGFIVGSCLMGDFVPYKPARR